MAKYTRPVLKRTFRRKMSYRGKSRGIVQAQTYFPRTVFPKMPSEMRVSLTLCQQHNYNVGAGAFATFNIGCLNPIGLDGYLPDYFYDLLRIYSLAHTLIVDSTVTFTSIDNANEAMNVVCALLPSIDAAHLQLNQATMDRLRSKPGAQVGYLGTNQGGHDVVKFRQKVEISKYIPYSFAYEYAMRSGYDALGNLQVQPPQAVAIETAPAVTFMYTPTQVAAFDFQVIRDITYSVRFSGLHLGSATQVIV